MRKVPNVRDIVISHFMHMSLALTIFLCNFSFAYAEGNEDRQGYSEPSADIQEYLTVSGEVSSDFSISRSQGVAPLSVHFKADYAEDREGLGDFHSLNYKWNFGDSRSGVWNTDQMPKNIARGPIATHVFDAPGEYEITLSVTDDKGALIKEMTERISVQDPEAVFRGKNTICVSNDRDFSGAPHNAMKITTDNLDDVMKYIKPGTRVLFRRGARWISNGLDFPDNSGPVHIGAFGEGTGADSMGHFSNAPLIELTDGTFCNLDNKQDWRITDLHLVNENGRAPDSFGGGTNFQRILISNIKVEGFYVGIGWSHWNDEKLMTLDELVIANTSVMGSRVNCIYVGGERVALLGNKIENSMESHTARVWQAYQSVISHNVFSGSSLESGDGRHALKLHGPGNSIYEENELGEPVPESPLLKNYSEEIVISDNLFGASGPWPVIVGPQDQATETKMFNILFEGNRIATGYGKKNSWDVNVALHFFASCSTIRNNVFDGTGSNQNDYIGIRLGGDQVLPTENVLVYRNSIYRRDNTPGDTRFGISIGRDSSGITVLNNIVCFPDSSAYTLTVEGECENLTVAGNTLSDESDVFTDPDNEDPLKRLFFTDANESRNVGIYRETDFQKKQ